MKRYEKYKDSKVEWIGEIPKHWEIKKLKYLVIGKLEYGANEPAESEIESNPRYIRITDFGEVRCISFVGQSTCIVKK
jgi:type I restriction enzyme S subunit